MAGTRLYVKGAGKNQRSTARQIVTAANRAPIAQHVLDATTEFPELPENVIVHDYKARYGVWYVRSRNIRHLFYIVNRRDHHGYDSYECTCARYKEDKKCEHIRQVRDHQLIQAGYTHRVYFGGGRGHSYPVKGLEAAERRKTMQENLDYIQVFIEAIQHD